MLKKEYASLKNRIAAGGSDGSRALLDLQVAMRPGLIGVFAVTHETIGTPYAVMVTLHEALHGTINLITRQESIIGAVTLETPEGVMPQPFCVMRSDLEDNPPTLRRLALSLHELAEEHIGGHLLIPNSQIKNNPMR